MEKYDPLVTIGMVTYNSGKFLNIAINSVLRQTYQNIELIINDDNSTDDTWAIIQSYSDKRIVANRNKLNIGEYPNREAVLKLATGKYFIFLDGDDLLYPHGIEHMTRMIEAFPNAAMALSQTPKLNIIYPYELTSRQTLVFDLLSYNYINHHGFPYTFFRTEILREFWNVPDWILAGDTYIKMNISLEHNVVLIPDGLAWWRETPGQASGKLKKNMKGKIESLFFTEKLLSNRKCPLSDTEKKQVLINQKGVFLREVLFAYLLKGKINIGVDILKNAKIKLSDIHYMFKRPFYIELTDEQIINPLTDFYKNPFLK